MIEHGWGRDAPLLQLEPADPYAELLDCELPREASAAHLMPPYRLQGDGNSCVAQGLADIVYAAHMRQVDPHELDAGFRPELLSVRHLWWLARLERGTERRNVGTTTRTAIRVANRHGYMRASHLPYDTRLTTIKPAVRLDRLSCDQRNGLTCERLREKGAARVEAIKRSIAAGYPVAIGYQLDRSMMAESALDLPSGQTFGHLMVAYEFDQYGIKHRNWWATWPDVWVSYRHVRAFATDPWICLHADNYSDPVA